jgi:amino acid transporter
VAIDTTPGGPAPESLRRGAVRPVELLSSSMAEIAPAIATFFVFGSIVAGAGVGAPLIILLAGIGFLFHVNTSAQFNRVIPSAGSYVTYFSRSFGRGVGSWLGSAYLLGFFLVYCAVFYQMGVWVNTMGLGLFNINIPWWIPTLVFEAITIWITVRGVKISVQVAVTLFSFELLMLIVGAIAMLIANHHFISAAGFNPARIHGGVQGLGLAFPLCVFLFLGASSGSSPLAEESHRPHTSIPTALFGSTIAATIIYVIMAWAEGIGFHNNSATLVKSAFPFITAAGQVVHALSPLLYIAGFTSAFAVLIANANTGSRVVFNVSREGLLPRVLSRVHPTWRTPWLSLIYVSGLAMIVTLALGFGLGATNAFDYTSTLGTDVLVLLFLVINVALPIYFRRHQAQQYRTWTHLIAPIIGILIFLYPVWTSIKPNQPAPYNLFWLYTVLAYLVAAGYAWLRRGKVTLGDNVIEQEEPSPASAGS